MQTQLRPVLVALALALAGTGAASAQSDGGDNGKSVRSRSDAALQRANAASDGALSGNGSATYNQTHTQPDVGIPASPTAVVRSSTGEPVRTGDAPARSTHVALGSDDAQERAARAAAANRDEEEHGGFWNRVRNFFHHHDD